jgi:hypothetical protein
MTSSGESSELRHGWTPTAQQKESTDMPDKRHPGPHEERGYKPNAGQTPAGDNPSPKPPAGGFSKPPSKPPPPSDDSGS